MLPRFGIEKDVRVCDGCFDQIQKPTTAAATTAASTKSDEEELPAEYLKSSLAQQNQVQDVILITLIDFSIKI